jgi:Glycolipid 2-alpha-mannosyltransferase
MSKPAYSSQQNGVSSVRRRRPARQIATFVLVILLTGSLWYILSNAQREPTLSPTSSVYVHKAEGEIDVISWPEERWFEGPRNESQLEKAALIMLVRYISANAANRRNSELHPARSAMREVEDRFNKRFGYPWVFVNDEPFTDEYHPLFV